MRRLALIALLITAAGAGLAASAAGDRERTYFIELDNAFGLVEDSEVRIAGVEQGTIEELLINQGKRAVAKVRLSGPLATLGERTICSSEPQSLIAEYFLDCEPRGAPLAEGTGDDAERAESPDIPVAQTRQVIQQDLALSALRRPYRERLRILLNEFGTALAGNPEDLNAAIRRGAPALEQTRQVTRILGDQNRIIRELNVNSDRIIGELAARREDVRRFVERAGETAGIAADRRAELSDGFARLDDFLAELGPTMGNLNRLAVEGRPLLRDLRAAGPGLGTLSGDLPAFNESTEIALAALGRASRVGRRALLGGRDEIAQLAAASRRAFGAADPLAKLLRDLDDPDRHVVEDRRAAVDTGRPEPTGYSGLEGLLNYVYYQAGSINQFDQLGHMLHLSVFEAGGQPCHDFNPGPTVPARDGGETTEFSEIDPCVAWLGPHQPGISFDAGAPPYHPSVCRDGSNEPEICDPGEGATSRGREDRRRPADRAEDLLDFLLGRKGNGGR